MPKPAEPARAGVANSIESADRSAMRATYHRDGHIPVDSVVELSRHQHNSQLRSHDHGIFSTVHAHVVNFRAGRMGLSKCTRYNWSRKTTLSTGLAFHG